MVLRKTKPLPLKPAPQMVGKGLTKQISVMAWIEDPYGQILMVRQAYAKKLWALPGGKVHHTEPVLTALKREVLEETGYRVAHAYPIDLFDRHQKSLLTILYRVLLKPTANGKPIGKPSPREISGMTWQNKLPRNCTPSARFFWDRAQSSFEPLTWIG